jgi:cell division septum initiation protein DivIVA
VWRSETSGAHESFSVVRKGYDREAVDRFIADLRSELEQTSERIAKLEVELTQARQTYETLREDTRLALSDPERASKLLGQEASEVLKSANDAALGLRRKAESTAKDLVERARREAEEITRQAKLAAESELEEGRQVARAHLEEVRQQGREILAMADSTASNTVEAAKREGRSLVFRAREHASNLTQQAENRAAQVREEISALDLERQHLIGILRSAQDLIRSSLTSLDTRPLTSETAITSVHHANQTEAAGKAQTHETHTQEPAEASSDEIASLSTMATSIHPGGAGDDQSDTQSDRSGPVRPEMTFAEVARLIELAAEQTAALGLDDADEAFLDGDITDPADQDVIDVDPQEQSSIQVQSDITSTLAGSTVDDSAEGDSANDAASSSPEANTLALSSESTDPMPTPEPSQITSHDLTTAEFDDEIVVVERYRQVSTGQPTPEDPKSRLQRLEALFSELRDEGPELQLTPPPDEDINISNTNKSSSEDQDVMLLDQPIAEVTEPHEEVPQDQETDQLAQKIRSSLRDLFDPRSIDLSRRVKRITQDDLNQILATIRSSGREGAVTLIEQIVNDSQSRAGDVRLLIARVVHAGSDFAATLGDRNYDPSGKPFDKIVEEIAIDLTDTLGQATLVRALEAIAQESEMGETELVARTNGIYREARRKLDELINDSAYRAFCRGSRLVPGATGYLWVTSSPSQPCADCEDNLLAGINPLTETFPTGHENPPAHPGCTCVIVPVFA